MNTQPLIKVDSLGKKFCRQFKRSLLNGAQDVMFDFCGVDRSRSPLRQGEFWANRDISFELKRGECLGLIGRNGAGKTTLLKMLNGLIKPDVGQITIHGRVSALIALNAGFKPILTGRENIYIIGSVLGLNKKEIDEKMEEILEFSELDKFIDSPVQNYSSGMQVRLGFSVATALNPDVLIIDEVLAVGDANFRIKCANKIDQMREQCAVIFVSHNMEHISRICNRVLLLKQGQSAYCGDVIEGISKYNDLNIPKMTQEDITCFDPILKITPKNYEMEMSEFSIEPEFNITIKTSSALIVVWRIIIRNVGEKVIFESDSRNTGDTLSLQQGVNQVTIKGAPISLVNGNYKVSIVLLGEQGETFANMYNVFDIRSSNRMLGVSDAQFNSRAISHGS